jgi:uncharacterized membrane protein YfcA
VDGFLLLVLVGIVAQLVDGSMGMAYGVTSTTILLTAGYAPAVASASVHLSEVGTTLASGLSHWRFGNVDWVIVRRMGVAGALGAFVGAVALSEVSTEFARPWMAGLLMVLGGYILVRFSFARHLPTPRGRPYVRPGHLAALGAVAGFVDASGGGGWGPVATPVLMSTGRLRPRRVVGSVDASEFLVSVAASLGFLAGLGSSGVDLRVTAALLVGGIVAAPVAAWLVRRIQPRLLGCGVGGVILATDLRTVLESAGVDGGVRWVGYGLVACVWLAALVSAFRLLRADRLAREPIFDDAG